MSGKRLSKTEKLELLRRIVLHLDRQEADVRWIPVVQRFVERWNTRHEAPATVMPPFPGATPLRYRAFIIMLELQSLLDTRCPGCNNPTRLPFFDRTASGALRCADCRDRMTTDTEKKENKP